MGPKAWRPYGFAVVCVAVATALRLMLGLIWPDILIFATYYPAVLIAALACGVSSGAVTAILGAIAAWWFFIPPAHHLFPISGSSAAGITVYLACSVLIVWAAGRRRTLVLQLRREMTEREKAQRDSAQLAMLVTQSPDAIFSVNLDGTIATWNPGAAALFGYTAAEAIGRRADILVPDDKREEFEDAIARVRSGRPVELETERLAKSGERIAVDILGGPLRDGAGTIIGTGVAARDIRERKRHQHEMQIVLHELSHRAKNLLSVVSAMANQTALGCESFKDFQPRFAARLQALARSHDVLVERDWKGVPMNELISVQLAPFQEIGSGRIIATGPGVIIAAKPAEQIGLCLHELATNATKYGAWSTPTGTVEISWEVAGHRISIDLARARRPSGREAGAHRLWKPRSSTPCGRGIERQGGQGVRTRGDYLAA